MKRTFQPSPLALAILVLLYEEPMHPYRMQQLIKQRNKDEVINVQQRMSVYQTIERLQRDGLIAVRETVREENRPERTIYQITDEGYKTAVVWMRAMLSTPRMEYPEFPAAVSLMPLLKPADVQQQLEKRIEALVQEINRLSYMAQTAPAALPRLFILESEYTIAMLKTELEWVRSVVNDLRSGQLTWTFEGLRTIAQQLEPPPP